MRQVKKMQEIQADADKGKKQKRGLGMGVEALFFKNIAQKENIGIETSLNDDNTNKIINLPIGSLVPGRNQPRKSFDEAASTELCESIKQHGVLQPILVWRNDKEHNYEIIAGERRWRAAKSASLNEIPAIILKLNAEDPADAKKMLLLGLVENLQREDLNCLEEAYGIKKIITEHDFTHEQVAKLLSKSRSSITNSLRLLLLSQKVQEYIINGDLEMGHVRALLTLPESTQIVIADKAVNNHLSVRGVEKLVKKYVRESNIPVKPAFPTIDKEQSESKGINGEVKQFIQELEDKIGLPITYQVTSRGKGEIKINFSRIEQFIHILNQLNKLDYSQK